MTIAEIYEAEEAAQQNLEGALKHYETAADYYRGEEAQRCAAPACASECASRRVARRVPHSLTPVSLTSQAVFSSV